MAENRNNRFEDQNVKKSQENQGTDTGAENLRDSEANKAQRSNRNDNDKLREHESNRMTRSEAGRKGGKAEHECRGMECHQEGSEKKKSSKKDDDNNDWSLF